ncbi:MAG: polyprenyl synthetase family protein [candidate division Zixibacteria bacterium]|nr:polyprenyl synthetase family protein [candidate division Zixibacteria bacterium]
MTQTKMSMTGLDIRTLFQPIQPDLAAFDKRMSHCLQCESTLISAVANHILASRGKRLRPALIFLLARSSGNYSRLLLDVAQAIELIHTATLLHDDVVDESDFRRGQDTVNARWTNLVSVLMGDFLFTRAFRVLVETDSAELIKAISAATQRVSFGELRQIEEVSNYNLSEAEYIRIISDKTASLFSISCESTAILKKASPGARKRFRQFGENVGIAFQITDDLLDYIGNSDTIGKPPGADLQQGKVTIPLIYSLSKASRKTRGEMIRSLNRPMKKTATDRVLKFVLEQGGIEYGYATARGYADLAAGVVESFPRNKYAKALRSLVEFAVARDK